MMTDKNLERFLAKVTLVVAACGSVIESVSIHILSENYRSINEHAMAQRTLMVWYLGLMPIFIGFGIYSILRIKYLNKQEVC